MRILPKSHAETNGSGNRLPPATQLHLTERDGEASIKRDTITSAVFREKLTINLSTTFGYAPFWHLNLRATVVS